MKSKMYKLILISLLSATVASLLTGCKNDDSSYKSPTASTNLPAEDSPDDKPEKVTVSSINVIKGIEDDCNEFTISYHDENHIQTRATYASDGKEQADFVSAIASVISSGISEIGPNEDLNDWSLPYYELTLSNDEYSYVFYYKDGHLLSSSQNTYLIDLPMADYWNTAANYSDTIDSAITKEE